MPDLASVSNFQPEILSGVSLTSATGSSLFPCCLADLRVSSGIHGNPIY